MTQKRFKMRLKKQKFKFNKNKIYKKNYKEIQNY